MQMQIQVVGGIVLRHIESKTLITVYAGHLKSGGWGDGKTKEDQASQLAADIVKQKKLGRSIILAGDLNCHWTGKESTPHDVLHNLCDKTKFQENKEITYTFVKDLKWDKEHATQLYNNSFLKSAYREVSGEPYGTTAKTRLCGHQLSKVNEHPAIEVEDYIYIDETFTAVSVWLLPYQLEIAAEIKQIIEELDEVTRGRYQTQVDANEKIHDIEDLIRAIVVKKFLGAALLPNFHETSDHMPIATVIRYFPGRRIRPRQGAVKQTVNSSKGSLSDVSGVIARRKRSNSETRHRSNATHYQYKKLEPPISIKKLFRQGKIGVGSRVVCTQSKYKGLNPFNRECIRQKGEVGLVTAASKKAVRVQWFGHTIRQGKAAAEGSEGPTTSKISAYTEPKETRRRMAQREFSSRRDSPVMVRLLEEIIAAQDK